jgi:hypothetical protein
MPVDFVHVFSQLVQAINKGSTTSVELLLIFRLVKMIMYNISMNKFFLLILLKLTGMLDDV